MTKMAIVDFIRQLDVNHLEIHGQEIKVNLVEQSAAFREVVLNLNACTAEGIIVDTLSLSIKNGKLPLQLTSEQIEELIEKTPFSAQLKVRILDNYIYKMIKKQVNLNEIGMEKLELTFDKNLITIGGQFRKIVAVPFIVHLKPTILQKKKVKISVKDTEVMGMIPIPHFVNDIIFNSIVNNMHISFITFRDDALFIDFTHQLPPSLDFEIEKIGTEKGYLYVYISAFPKSAEYMETEVKKTEENNKKRSIKNEN